MITWKTILKNFISLASAELLSKLIAFFTTVYLARVITPAGFGIVGFATAFISYFILFVDLGIDTISLKKIAKNQNIISSYVNNILSFRVILSVLIYIILVFVVILLNITWIQKAAILLLGINLLVQSISLEFVFQATEKIKYLSIKIIGMNLLALILIPTDFKLESEGTLQPVVRRDVFFDIGGTITDVHVKDGMHVRKGDKLIDLVNYELEQEWEKTIGQVRHPPLFYYAFNSHLTSPSVKSQLLRKVHCNHE